MAFANEKYLFSLLFLMIIGCGKLSAMPDRVRESRSTNEESESSNSISAEESWNPLSQLPDAALKTMMAVQPSEQARAGLEAWMALGDAATGNPEETGAYFEGDMVSQDRFYLHVQFGPCAVFNLKYFVIVSKPGKFRNGLRAQVTRWKNGKIPYVITGQFMREEHDLIHKAMWEYGNRTCVRWVDVHRNMSPDYVVITSEKTGCWSNVGRVGGEQQLNLERPGCLRTVGTVVHEMMHTLGFVHEQNRYERDDWIKIQWENLQPKTEANFVKMSKKELNPFGVKYDYGSVMHYSSHAFSKNGQPTIVPKRTIRQVTIGQRDGFSESDIRKIKAMYCQ